MPMRRWPRPIRCSVAVMPPAQFEMPTEGVPGSGAVGSTMTTGRPSAFSRSRCCGREVGEDQHHAVAAAGAEAVEPAGLLGRVGEGGDGDAAAVGVRGLLGAADDLGGVGAELGEDEVDQPGPVGLAAAGVVAGSGEHRLDAAPGVGGDVGAAVQDLGDGGDRHLGRGGDLGHRHAAGIGQVRAFGRHGPRKFRDGFDRDRSTFRMIWQDRTRCLTSLLPGVEFGAVAENGRNFRKVRRTATERAAWPPSRGG